MHSSELFNFLYYQKNARSILEDIAIEEVLKCEIKVMAVTNRSMEH